MSKKPRRIYATAAEIFAVMRAWSFELSFGHLLDTRRAQLKDTIIWNIEEGRKLSGPQLGAAELKRTQLFHRMRAFMEKYEFLIAPVVQVLPFDVNTPYVTRIDGVELHSYIDWMRSCSDITVTGAPAVSVPCGFSASGLPVGLQIVGRQHDDLGVLQIAPCLRTGDGVLEAPTRAGAILKKRNPGTMNMHSIFPASLRAALLLLAVTVVAPAAAQTPSDPPPAHVRKDRIFLKDIEGIWINEPYLGVLSSLKSPHAAAKKTAPVVIAIRRDGRAFPIVVTDFNKASLQAVLDIEPDGKPGAYRLVVARDDKPTSGSDVKFIRFEATRNAQGKIDHMRIAEPDFMKGKWADYVPLTGELSPQMNRFVLSGKYEDEKGRRGPLPKPARQPGPIALSAMNCR